VLDAGAGDSPYRERFAHVQYESADFERVPGKRYAASDYVCDLAAIPVEDHRYDLVLLSQVLEHLPEPGAVLAELRRVLKPGGTIWASAPLFYEEHEVPYDFFRYTQLVGRSSRDLRWRAPPAGDEARRVRRAAPLASADSPARGSYWMSTGVPTGTRLNRSITSATCMRMQPCDAREPIE
jgi:SAM-dependent methyltransferase